MSVIIVRNRFTALEAIKACEARGISLEHGLDAGLFSLDYSWGWCLSLIRDEWPQEVEKANV